MKYFILFSLLNLILNLTATPAEIFIDQIKVYNYDNKEFKLNYSRKTEKSFVFFIFYEREVDRLDITIIDPNLKMLEMINLNEKEGVREFSFVKNGIYDIKINYEGAGMTGMIYGKDFYGKIRIVSTEFPFTFDLNKDFELHSIKN